MSMTPGSLYAQLCRLTRTCEICCAGSLSNGITGILLSNFSSLYKSAVSVGKGDVVTRFWSRGEAAIAVGARPCDCSSPQPKINHNLEKTMPDVLSSVATAACFAQLWDFITFRCGVLFCRCSTELALYSFGLLNQRPVMDSGELDSYIL